VFERGWRAVATILSYLVWGVCSLLFCYLVYPATAWRIPGKQRQLHARALTRKGFRFFIDFMQWLGVWRYHVEGGKRLRQPGRVIIANHPSFLDVVLLLGLTDNAVCIVKPALLGVPLVSAPLRRCGHVIADSPETVLENSIRVLTQGASLILFPQGTRIRPGLPLRFHRSAARIALDAKAPLLPVYFRYRPLLLERRAVVQYPPCTAMGRRVRGQRDPSDPTRG